MGATPLLVSTIGNDLEGDFFLQLLEQSEIATQFILTTPNRRTTSKTRIIAQKQHLLRIDSEQTDDISIDLENELLNIISNILQNQKIDVIIFQDYNKGVLTQNVIKRIIFWANSYNIPTTVDPKKNNFFAFQNVTLFKPNLKEIRESLSAAIQPDARSLVTASQKLRAILQHQITLITLSEKGIFIEDSQTHYTIPTQAIEVADVSGAGDTVISVASLALCTGLDLQTIAALSNLAGGQVCGQVGVVPVNKDVLIKNWLQNHHTYYEISKYKI